MFIFNKSLSGENFPTVEVFPTTANETYVEGEALKIASGKLTKCGPSDKPQYIAAKAYVAPSSGQKPLPVFPVLPHYEWLTTFAADATLVPEGTVVTLHTDGAQITATSMDNTTPIGVATIVKKLGTGDVGTEVLVRFE